MATLLALETPMEQLGEKFIFDSFEASQALSRPMGLDTYNELISNGSLKIIPRPIRERLAQYYRELQQLNH